MSKELVISSNRHETRVAILEDDVLVEIYFQRANEYSLAGSIHKGRVTRVLPGMQSAFVDLGLDRDTFLYVSDFFDDNHDDLDKIGDEKPARAPRPEFERPRIAERPREVVVAPPPIVGEPLEDLDADGPEEIGAEVDSEVERPQVAGATASGEVRPFQQRDRRDRDRDRGRGRRRRGGRGGLPESKYSSGDSEPAEAPAVIAAPRYSAPEVHVPAGLPSQLFASAASGAAPALELAPVDEAPVFLLPGESLAKYRRKPAVMLPATDVKAELAPVAEVPPPPVAAEPVAAEPVVIEPVAVEPVVIEPVEAEPVVAEPVVEPIVEAVVAAPAPIAEPEPAAVVPPPPPVVETVTVEPEPVVEAIAAPPEYIDTAFAKLPPEIDVAELEAVDAIEEAREELLVESDDDDDELDAAQAAAEGLLAEEAVDDDADGEDEDGDAEPVEGADATGPEPARQPHSLTAALRERDRGSRFQRGRRGRRRRGRGSDERREDRPAGAPTGEPRPAEARVVDEPEEFVPGEERVVEARPVEPRGERPERAERPDRGPRPPAARERSDRGDRGDRADRGDRPPMPLITDLLKAGQEILVQIAKEPIGQKGARITSHIALPGRYCVYMPTVDHNGVSRKIDSDDERLRLKRILQQHRQGMTGGFIIRTAGEGQSEEDIAIDMKFLYNLWIDIRTKSEKRPAPLLVHHDLDIVQRTLRDQVTSDFKTIWLDNEELYASTVQFIQRFQPALLSRVKLWTRPVPIFEAFNISNELEKALRPKVWLKSGGYIVINQTEALVAIDINTGKFVGKSNRLEDTIVKTNTEAVKEIVRQIRLRDLGGIIVVDFIDMDERKNRQKVMMALEEAMQQDRAPYKILQFNDFGLVAITRKRVKQSLERTLCQPCIYCEGAGYVKNVQTVIGEILVEAQKLSKAVDDKTVVLRVHPEVAKVLKSHRNQHLEELEAIFGRPVLVTGDAAVHIEKFDLA